MKKLIAILLSLVLLLGLAACGAQQEAPATEPTEPTNADVEQDQAQAPEEEKKPEDAFHFIWLDEGVKLIPGEVFDPSVLPEANHTFQVPSCAIEGTDDVYSYDAFELTAYNDGTGPVIYSIYLIDPNAPTPEGLYLGDDLETVESIYGTDYEDLDGELVYTKANTELRLLVEDGQVASIEYRMVTE